MFAYLSSDKFNILLDKFNKLGIAKKITLPNNAQNLSDW